MDVDLVEVPLFGLSSYYAAVATMAILSQTIAVAVAATIIAAYGLSLSLLYSFSAVVVATTN